MLTILHYFQLNCFVILMIDYHNIHAKKVLTKLITAVHMVSCLLDSHPTIPAVPQLQQTPVHTHVKITIKGQEVTCYGGIKNSVIVQKMHQALVNMRKPFMNQLPSAMVHLSPNQLQESLRQLRQVSGKCHKLKIEKHIKTK